MKEMLRKIRLRINKIGNKKRNKQIENKEVTLISNNCWAGIVYQYLGLKFNSPTIGTYFMADEYIKFLEDLDVNIKKELEFIKYTESKYKSYLEEKKLQNMIIGKINDIEIFFLHYKTEEEAREKWGKRAKRVNMERLLVKFNDQNNCKISNLKEFDELNYKNKICFTAKDYKLKSGIWIKKYKKCDYVKDDLYSFHKYLNIINCINNIK